MRPNQMRGARASRGGTRPQLWTAVFAVLVLTLVLMACGYHVGTTSAASSFKVKEVKLLEDQKSLRETERLCDAQRADLLRSLDNIDSHLKSEFDLARRTYFSAQTEHDQAHRDMTFCEEDLAKTQATYEETTEESQNKREKLRVERGSLYAAAMELENLAHGDGAALIALTQDVARLRSDYLAACLKAPGCVVEPTTANEMPSFANTNAEEWKRVGRLDIAYAAQLPRDLWPPFTNTTLQTLAVIDQEGLINFFNRTEDEAPVSGNDFDTPFTEPRALLTQIYALVDAAFCAYSFRNPSVLFKTTFQHDLLADVRPRHAASSNRTTGRLSHLHLLVRTPLVTFCEDCVTEEWTAMCASHRSDRAVHYGSRDYWTARAMVRAASPIRAAADRFWHVQSDSVVLAVVAQMQPTYTDECFKASFNLSRGTHFVYATNAFTEPGLAVVEGPLLVSQAVSPFAECSTSAVALARAVLEVAGSAEPTPTALYLDMAPLLAVDVLTVLEAISPAWASKVIARPAPISDEAAADELLSHEIASRATHLLVSPYLLAGRYAVENCLLRNNFNASCHLWYL